MQKAIKKIMSAILILAVLISTVGVMSVSAQEPQMTLTVTPITTSAAHGNPAIAAANDVITFRVSMSSAAGRNVSTIAFRVVIPAGFEFVAGTAATDSGFISATGFASGEFNAGELASGQYRWSGISMGEYNGAGVNIATFQLRATSAIGNNTVVNLQSTFHEGHGFFANNAGTVIPSNAVPATINAGGGGTLTAKLSANGATLTVTLPQNAAAGDIIRVYGVGAGGTPIQTFSSLTAGQAVQTLTLATPATNNNIWVTFQASGGTESGRSQASGFGVVPPTGLADMTGATMAMFMFLLIALALWGYLLHEKFRKGRSNA